MAHSSGASASASDSFIGQLELQQPPGSGTPAPYGRACSNCARAKCKCMFRSEGDVCERCYRLNKQCQPSTPVRRRPAQVRKPATAKKTQLEEKLDEVVSLLKSSHHNSQFPDRLLNSFTDRGSGVETIAAALTGPSRGVLTPPVSTPDTSLGDNDEPSPQEAEETLQYFRAVMLNYFPFLYLAPSMTARQLREERPFLWLAIMAVATRVYPRQGHLSDKFRATVAQKMIVEHEKSLELLQGLLTLVAWGQHAKTDKPFLSIYAELAQTLVFELGLHKPPSQNKGFMMCIRLMSKEQIERTTAAASRPPTKEESRAALACFILTSILSVNFKRIDALRWTRRMDEHLHALSDKAEWAQDALFVAQVRLQLIMEQLNQTDWQLGDGNLRISEPDQAIISPLLMAILHSKVDEVKSAIPLEFATHEAILTPLHFTELMLSECAVSQLPPTSPTSAAADLTHLTNLDRCVQSIKGFFDSYFKIPSAHFISLPLSYFSYFSHCLITLYGLSTLDYPSWDRNAVRNTVDVLAMLDCFIQVMAELPQNAGLAMDAPTTDMFTRGTKVLTALRDSWEADLNTISGHNTAAQMEGVHVPSADVGPGVPPDIMASMGMSDEAWFRDVFIPWEDSAF